MLGFSRGTKTIKPQPMIDLAYGRYISYCGHEASSLPHRIVVFAKGRKQHSHTRIVDVPESALVYLPPEHPETPSTGVWVLLAGSGAASPIGEKLELVKASALEKMAEAAARIEAAETKIKLAERTQLETVEETTKKVTETMKEMREATQPQYLPYDPRSRKGVT